MQKTWPGSSKYANSIKISRRLCPFWLTKKVKCPLRRKVPMSSILKRPQRQRSVLQLTKWKQLLIVWRSPILMTAPDKDRARSTLAYIGHERIWRVCIEAQSPKMEIGPFIQVKRQLNRRLSVAVTLVDVFCWLRPEPQEFSDCRNDQRPT